MTEGIKKLIKKVNKIYQDDKKVQDLFLNGIRTTYEKALTRLPDGSVFVLTGDIPAMWLRDSAAQVKPLLIIANKDEEIKSLIKGVIEKQKEQILVDPYANAFNIEPNGNGHQDDTTEMTKLTWERKFEVDSLCYPIWLSYLYFLNTKDDSIFDKRFLDVMKQIVNVFVTEQHHEEKSKYRFIRTNPGIMEVVERQKYETLARNGLGTKVKYTGMIWSGFRPSDDACQYGYLVPSNMFAVVILKYMTKIIKKYYEKEIELLTRIKKLIREVNNGIKKYAIINHEKFGQVYAFEVDGFGNYLLMDDANVPSLLSIPYLKYKSKNDPIYLNTRKLILSKENPFYFEGKFAKGIGSPHTPENHIWHIALAIESMTTDDINEKLRILNYFKTTDANTNLMHEGFNVDNPHDFSREWFSWANSMFAEFLLDLNNIHVKGF